MKIGLVIQGPFISIGRTGGNLHASPERLATVGGIVHYDCRENINKIISKFGNLFDQIVISTWDNELKKSDIFPGARIVSVPDPGGIEQVGHYKDNNKFRQFLSTLNGLKELEKSGMEYAVKMRTDQYLDLKKLTESFFAGIQKTNDDPRSIYVTVINPQTFLLHDLYFAARTKTLREFCEAVLAYDRFEFIASVHRDIVLKHAYVKYRKIIGVPDWAYFPIAPPSGVNAATRKIFDYMFKNIYIPLSPEVFRSTVWRGAHYEKEHVSSLLEVKHPRKYNLPAIISTDWERYFHFRLQTSGQRLSLLDRGVVKLGKWGWNFWNLVRKVKRAVLQ